MVKASNGKSLFNEMTRVQMPALVHLTRLGYTYYGRIFEDMADTVYDPDTNILKDVFISQFKKLNPEHEGEAEQVLKAIRQELDNDDLGKSFYSRLKTTSPVRLIDFDNPRNNVFHCTAEFTCKNGQDEFRPDITLFINGLPLVFIEVKKPNNHGGMVAESDRMNRKRFPNKKFRRFINITQLMIFSNNMEYDAEGGIVPIHGAFYCTAAKKAAPFNCFREENPLNEDVAPYIKSYPYGVIDAEVEKKILKDFNNQVIHTSPEYQTNLNVNTPTNRIITSMCSPERLLFILKYGIAYVNMEREVDGKIETINQKHIMRYQQMFAALAICEKLSDGVKSGVVWHTQGSGKTALSYYLSYYLSDYFAHNNKVAKFYFIVDRLDLLEQASQEFEARGLVVKTANSRAELMEQFRNNQAQEGNSGQQEITVVNIQRFAEDKERVTLPSYATNLQRIFIIDEAHRGYNPKGSFLANLFDADENSIKIALTGTPLLADERESWKVFGSYFHTYYYDKSIQDGYTLKIIREDIETKYKEKLSAIYEKLETLVQKKDIKRDQIVEHDSYVKELTRYIISDLKRFRTIQGDDTLGGMVICETSEQARKIFAFFDDVQRELNADSSQPSHFKAGLILHDSDDKDTRKQIVKDFKKNMTIDILIVFNMLLTGFDAPCLSTIFIDRQPMGPHDLIQAFSRTNRIFNRNKTYGQIVTFQAPKLFRKSVDDAVKLYSAGSTGSTFVADWEEVEPAFRKALAALRISAETPDEIADMSLKEKKVFVKIFQNFDRLFAQLKSFTRYEDSMLEEYCITQKEYEDYAGYYQNAMEEIRIANGDGKDQPGDDETQPADLDYELMAYSNTKIDYEYIINLIQNIVTPDEDSEDSSPEERQKRIDEVKQYVCELQKTNPKVAKIMTDLIYEIEMDDRKFRGKSILNIMEKMKYDCIDKVVSDFCTTWYASKEDVMYAAIHYRNGKIPNESVIKDTINYAGYKAAQEKPLPKFKYNRRCIEELGKILDEEIKPLINIA